MPKIIVDSHYDIGGYRDVYEDRVRTQHLVTVGGLTLTIAAVADGVGGENKGERASQTALDALFNFLEKSRETDIPTLLTQAVQYANKVVHQLQRETGGASTTLTLAVVENTSQRLYIANVGDSRVYLCRNKKLTQLTIDHSFANVMPWQGKISAEAAASHPRAQALMRAIGPKPDVEVDLGFYVNTTDYAEANARGQGGLPLQERDSVLVCSDGLIKDNPQGQLLITEAEIVRTLQEKEGKTAAKELVSFALGRGPDDNISAAVIQMPDPARAWRARLPLLFLGAAIIGLMCVLGIVGILFLRARRTANALAQVQTSTAAIEQTVSAFTPTPSNTPTHTATPTPTLPPFKQNQAGIRQIEGAPAFALGEQLLAGNALLPLLVYHAQAWSPPGEVFAFPNSVLVFNQGDARGFQLSLVRGGRVFLSSGFYPRASVILVGAASQVEVSVEGNAACLAVDYQPEPAQATLSCYEGQQCAYTILGGASGTIQRGEQVFLDPITLSVSLPQPISPEEAAGYAVSLPAGTTSHQCALLWVPPTPTPTPTKAPALSPTKTPKDTGDSEPPPPTSTPPPPTNTPKPPTNTPKPPTNTPLPPGVTPPPSTPVPPTKTLVPPTKTPTSVPSTSTPTQLPSNTPTPIPPSDTPVPPPTDTPVPTPPSDTPECNTGTGRICSPTP